MGKFIYPLGDGTREDFEKRFYTALAFGKKQSYGYHEGIDPNLKTLGNSDLGEPINAIADWELAYYHFVVHKNGQKVQDYGFGEHLVYEVQSPWGPRWIHLAHTQNHIDPAKKIAGKAGEKLAEINKTGRPRFILPAHLHIAVFVVDPNTLPEGIDTIARNKSQLAYWEDPIEFFNKWNSYKGEPEMDTKQLIIDLRKGLLGAGPSEDELKWDFEHWTNPKDFIERITGDAKFYAKYIQPQLEQNKKEMQKVCDTQIEDAEKKAKIEYNKLLLIKTEKLSAVDLILTGIGRFFSWLIPPKKRPQ